MTITIDLSNNLLNIVLAVIGIGFTIGTTWCFTRRHYIKESRPPTENEVIMQDNQLAFWFLAIMVGGIILFFALLAILSSFTGPSS